MSKPKKATRQPSAEARAAAGVPAVRDFTLVFNLHTGEREGAKVTRGRLGYDRQLAAWVGTALERQANEHGLDGTGYLMVKGIAGFEGERFPLEVSEQVKSWISGAVIDVIRDKRPVLQAFVSDFGKCCIV